MSFLNAIIRNTGPLKHNTEIKELVSEKKRLYAEPKRVFAKELLIDENGVLYSTFMKMKKNDSVPHFLREPNFDKYKFTEKRKNNSSFKLINQQLPVIFEKGKKMIMKAPNPNAPEKKIKKKFNSALLKKPCPEGKKRSLETGRCVDTVKKLYKKKILTQSEIQNRKELDDKFLNLLNKLKDIN